RLFSGGRAATQNTGNVVDNLVVWLALAAVEPLFVRPALRGAALLARRIRFVIGDDPTDGRENLLQRRFRSSLLRLNLHSERRAIASPKPNEACRRDDVAVSCGHSIYFDV